MPARIRERVQVMTICWLAPLLFLTLSAADEVLIQKADMSELDLSEEELPLYTVIAPIYRAEIFRTGRVQLASKNAILIRNFFLEHGREVKVLGNISLEKGNSITLREGEVRQKELTDDPEESEEEAGKALGDVTQAMAGKVKMPDLPGFTLHFLPDRIEIEPRNLAKKSQGRSKEIPAAFILSGVFGDETVAVKNLRNGYEDALPANYICSTHIFSFYGWLGHYWPEIEVTSADGTAMEIRGLSGISHYRIGKGGDPYTNAILNARRGYFSLRDAKDEDRISIRIQSSEAGKPLKPAPYFSIRPDKPRSLFFEDEPVLYHLDFAKDYLAPGQWQLQWTLEDHRQRPAGGGEQEVRLTSDGPTLISLNLKPKLMGYFRARLVLSSPDGNAARRTHEFAFSRVRAEHPDLRDLEGQRGIDEEMLWANILGMRGLRITPSLTEIWKKHHQEDGEIDWDAYSKELEDYLGLCRRGTVKGIVALMSGSPDERTLNEWFEKKYPDEEERKVKSPETRLRWMKEWAAVYGKAGIHAWEPINEPNLGMPPEHYIENILKPQYSAIKAGDPNANFLGGSICGLDNYGWVRRLYELEGDKYFDGTSLHPYTGLGFHEIYRAELDQWGQILRDYKDAEQSLWMTESAWHRGWSFHDYVHERFNAFRQTQAHHAVLMQLNAEAMGIPRERVYVFYLTEHGYNEFFLINYTHPTPAAISIQVMNECLRDARFVKEIPLPGKGHHLQIYRDDTRTVAASFTNGEPASLDFLTDASEVEGTDLMGNRRVIRPEGGKFTVNLSVDATYLKVGPGQSIDASYENLKVQPNEAILALGASTSASSGGQPDNKWNKASIPTDAAISGDWTCYGSSLCWNGERQAWREEEGGKDQFPDWFEVKLHAPVPVVRVRVYHDYGAWDRILKDYDVQVLAEGDWKTVDQVRNNLYQDIFDHRFEAVTTDRVRVLIHNVNSCLFENMQWIPKLSSLRGVEVYGSPQSQAKAFFIHELPRKRVVAPGAGTELTFRLKNATKARLEGEVRLILPQALEAEPAHQKLAVEAQGEAGCSFNVRLTEQAEEGIYTVLAGLYQGQTLLGAEYAPRVLCCKKPPPPPASKNDAPKEPKREEKTKDEASEDEEGEGRDALDVLLEAEKKKVKEKPPLDAGKAIE